MVTRGEEGRRVRRRREPERGVLHRVLREHLATFLSVTGDRLPRFVVRELQRYLAVDDAGNIVNPLLAEGQRLGGIVQGLGQALCEELIYDPSGQLLTATLMDYAMPRASMFPRFELEQTVTTTWVNPLGAKGIGELGTIGSTPCLVSAVLDALRPLGVDHIDMPVKPERIWRAIRRARGAAQVSA
jgi:carbon-monoxide dehydrogenase large subunit